MISSNDHSNPIFVLKEVLENLDKRSLGNTIYELESGAYFFRLVRILDN
jgi:hypothetical protein